MSKRKRKARNRGAPVPQPLIPQAIVPRNPLFNHPLMNKSHVHDKSHKAKRRAEKVKGARDWYSQSFIIVTFFNTILRIPVFNKILTAHF
ncbi:MAG: hypothetical protein OQL19_01420 [Gammaproteobacteria bacterium]|nr:hypothetical protein [Gammaproteobacteria bacterium]